MHQILAFLLVIGYTVYRKEETKIFLHIFSKSVAILNTDGTISFSVILYGYSSSFTNE